MTLKNIDHTYIIKVLNRQTMDGKTDEISETAGADYYEKNGKQYIIYKTENEGDTVTTVIKIDGHEMVIKRSGSINSHMTYKAGAATKSVYKLAYGEFAMEIETHRLITSVDENGGKIELSYTLTLQGEKHFNDMKITISKR